MITALPIFGTVTGGSLNFDADGSIFDGSNTLVDVTNVGTITKQINTQTTLEGTITNQGTLTFQGDGTNNIANFVDTSFLISSAVTLNGGGEVVLNSVETGFDGNGTISRIDIVNQATIRAEGGTLDINGDVTGNGTVAAAAGAELNFDGNTLQASTVIVDPTGTFDFNGNRLEVLDFIGDFDQDQGTYAPGASPAVSTLSGNYTATGGSLEIEIEGTAIGQFDQLLVSGDATLSGVNLSVVSQTGFTASPGDVFGIMSVGGTQSGLFNNGAFIEGATVATLGSPLRITYTAGDGNDIALFTTTNPTSVNFTQAGPGDEVYFVGNRGLTLDTNTFEFKNFELLDGQGFTLGPNETIVLDGGNGTFFVREGAVFSGNGIIDGNLFNAGLVRIPIVRLQNISRVTGSVVEIITTQSEPPPVVFSAATYNLIRRTKLQPT